MTQFSLWRRLGALVTAVLVAAATLIAVSAAPAAAAPGDRDASFTPLTLNDVVYSVTEVTVGVNAGKYLIGGIFTDAGGDTATDYVARLNADGSRDTSFTPLTLNGSVRTVTELTVGVNAGKYLIGGLFTNAGGNAATDYVARLNADGSRDTSFTPLTLSSSVRTVTELTVGANAGKYLIGGYFVNAGGDAATDRVARLNADGTRDTSFTPLTLNLSVASVTEVTVGANAGKYLIGGYFTDAGGDTATDYVARLNADGSRDTSFTPLSLNDTVFTVAEVRVGASAGKYLVGGYFTDTGTVRVARLNADGSRDMTFTPLSFNDPAYSVTEVTVGANAGKYLVGGQFTDTGTVRVARLNADGTRDMTFTPLTLNNGSVWSGMEVTVGANAGKYLIGGSFTDAGGDNATDYVARLLAQLPTHTVTFVAHGGSGSMSPQSANAPTALDANAFTRAGYTFDHWNTAANDSGTDYADGASFPFTADATLFAQWKSAVVPKRVQVPLHECVTPGSTARSIPRRGSKRLMKPGCVTNAGKTVGVKVRATARTRGDLAYYRLYCKVGAHKSRGVSKNRSGAYCKKGSLRIRTNGYKLRLQIKWAAPANARYTAYKKTKNYRT